MGHPEQKLIQDRCQTDATRLPRRPRRTYLLAVQPFFES
jgi:hypothetical protein